MAKIHKFRPEDYWLIGLSCLSVLFIGLMLYVGTLQLRILTGILGIPSLIFIAFIIRRSYSKRRSQVWVTCCLLSSGLLALGAYLLTN